MRFEVTPRSFRTVRSVAIVGAVGALAVACAVPIDEKANSNISSGSQAIRGGYLDEADQFRGIGSLHEPGYTWFCTGTLVAPQWVLAARHCFDSPRGVNGTVEFHLGKDSNTAPAPDEVYVHTAAISNAVLIPGEFYKGFPAVPRDSDVDDDGDVARDVALIKLDTPVPPSKAPFFPVASIAGTPICTMTLFDHLGTTVGYGPTPDVAGYRNYFWASPWVEEYASCSGNCPATWKRTANTGAAGNVIEGDSGGPLFEGNFLPASNGGTPMPVCGVGSSYTFPFITTTNQYASVQRGDTQEFISDALVNPYTGRVWGDCRVPQGTPGADDEGPNQVGDGFRNTPGCDVCPNIDDPLQLDTDKDGVGDLCDNCPTVYNPGQDDNGVVGQRSHAGSQSFDRTRPPPPTSNTNGEVAAWQLAYPGDVCNNSPVSVLSPEAGSATTASNRNYLRSNIELCLDGAHPKAPTTESLVANNLFLSQDIVGETAVDTTGILAYAPLAGRVRYATCECESSVESACINSCPRGAPSPTGVMPLGVWKIATVEEAGGVVPTTGGFVSTNYKAVPSRASAPKPTTRALGWRYWSDYDLPYNETGGELMGTMLWSWVRSYDTLLPASNVTSDPASTKRRQDVVKFTLKETAPPNYYGCDALFAGVLPERAFRLPNVRECIRCGKIGTYRKAPQLNGEYVSSHSGVLQLDSVATVKARDVLAESNVTLVAAEDRGTMDSSAARGAVIRSSDHALLGTLAVNAQGLLDFHELLVEDSFLFDSPLPAGVAMSARRGEVVFFDARSYLNQDRLAIRRVSLSFGESTRATLQMTGGDLAGPVVAAAYRERDDSYYFISRGGGKVRLHRVGTGLLARMVYEWEDANLASLVGLSISEEGLIGITSARTSGFKVLTLDLHDDGTLAAVSNLSGPGPLALAASITPEGMMLERPGRASDKVIAFSLEVESDLSYHSLDPSSWATLFQ